MSITVVQHTTFNGAMSGSFGSNVTAGSTVFLFPFLYDGTTISTSAPVFNSGSVSGASKLFSAQQGSGSTALYAAIWMLPDLAGGAKSVGVTQSGGTVDSNVGLGAIEVSGLGASPALDSGAAPNPESGQGTSGTIASGSTGDITSAPEIILGAAISYGTSPTPSGGGWSYDTPSSNCANAWQVAASSGGAYSYTDSGSGQWLAVTAAVMVTPVPSGGGLLMASFP